MIFGLFRRRNGNRQIVDTIYTALTQAGRQEVFYAEWGVPDTVMGRFEMISAHMILFLRRSGDSGNALRGLAQEVVDAFFEDLDHSIREIGIGDMGVPKRMKKLARMFYGRYEAYVPAFEASDREALAVALGRNIFPGQSPEEAVRRNAGLLDVAARLISVDRQLSAVSDEDLLAGRVAILPPETEFRSDHAAPTA